MILPFRAMFLAVLVCCLGLLGIGLYLQHGLKLEPARCVSCSAWRLLRSA
jgi:disulfide bond formation protein DsbB